MKWVWKKIIFEGLLAICIFGAGLPLLWADSGSLKVGLLAPMTGLNPGWGKKEAVGIEMAVEKINRRGGINGTPVEIILYDTGSDAAQTLENYRKLAEDDHVLAVIGPLFSHCFEPLRPATNREKVVIIATASAKPGLSDLKKFPYAFRMTVSAENIENVMAKAWVKAHQIKSVALIYDSENVYTAVVGKTVWPEIFRELNVQILNRNNPTCFSTGDTDFTQQALQLKQYNPDGICIAALPKEGGLILKAIRKQGIKQPILGANAMSSQAIIEIAGEDAEGFWTGSVFNPDDPRPKVVAFKKEFTKRCEAKYPDMGCRPEQYSVVVHDILLFLVNIMKRKGINNDPEQLQENRKKFETAWPR